MTVHDDDATQSLAAGSTQRAVSGRSRWIAACVTALVVGVVVTAVASDEGTTEIAQSGNICPEAGDLPNDDGQQVADDAEQVACVREPTTSTTALEPATTTSTSLRVPAVTVPSTELRAQKGGLKVLATVTPPNLRTAEILTVSVKATDADGGELVAGVSWGEIGTVGGAPTPPILECAADEQEAVEPTEEEWTLRHSYRQAGKYRLVISVASGYCDGEGKTLTVDGVVAIGAGLLLSNGPLPPLLDAGPSSTGEPTAFQLGIDTLEPDGFIRRITVDWGDGTTPGVFDYPLSDCRDPGTSFPGPSRRNRREAHRYTEPGTYAIKVTVTSVGCSDGDPQTVETQATASM